MIKLKLKLKVLILKVAWVWGAILFEIRVNFMFCLTLLHEEYDKNLRTVLE